MDQCSFNARSGGLSDVSRKKLAREVGTSEQNISSLVKRLITPHIHPELFESAGVFTNLGLAFMRELFSLEASNGDSLGDIRKRFILAGGASDRFQTLYKSWVPPKPPEPDFSIPLPMPADAPLAGAIEAYHCQTIVQVQDDCPNFVDALESPSLTRVESGLYSLFYRRFRQMATGVVADAFADAMTDTLAEAESGLAFQMGGQQ